METRLYKFTHASGMVHYSMYCRVDPTFLWEPIGPKMNLLEAEHAFNDLCAMTVERIAEGNSAIPIKGMVNVTIES